MIPKFRAWIKDYQVMRSVEFIAFNEKGVAEIFTNPEDGEPEDFRHTHSPEQAILMQSTGVKDKKGAEIFKGDIIEHRYNSPLSGELVVHRFQVAWDEMYSRFCTIGIGLRHGVDLSSSACSRHFEVIGNIYENPELLEEVEK